MKKDKAKEMQKELQEGVHKIWLAGLGALAVAGEEGKALFESLVERGAAFESKSRAEVARVAARVQGTVHDAKSNVGMLWERVQGGLDEQVSSALHRLGVPTRAEIANLTKRVEDLTRSIEREKAKPAARGRASKAAK